MYMYRVFKDSHKAWMFARSALFVHIPYFKGAIKTSKITSVNDVKTICLRGYFQYPLLHPQWIHVYHGKSDFKLCLIKYSICTYVTYILFMPFILLPIFKGMLIRIIRECLVNSHDLHLGRKMFHWNYWLVVISVIDFYRHWELIPHNGWVLYECITFTCILLHVIQLMLTVVFNKILYLNIF